MNNVAVVSTIYPVNTEYVIEMLDSLVDQDFSCFDVILVNDGFSDLDHIIGTYAER